jgi:hypothetical protein
MDRIAEWTMAAFMVAGAAAVALWMVGAIHYDIGGGSASGRWMAAAWVVGVVSLFALWQPWWQPFAALLGIAALFLAWWLRLRPSHDREWDPSVAVLPRAVCEGDVVTIQNVRNFEYRSLVNVTQ